MKKYKITLFILFGNFIILLFSCGRRTIHINDASKCGHNNPKIAIPRDATVKAYTWFELCEYLGCDVELNYLPEGFDSNVDSKNYELYVSSDGEVLLDDVGIEYFGKDNEMIRCVVSKGKKPVTDVIYFGGESSVIRDTTVYIYQKGNTFNAVFLYDGIGYSISTSDVSEEDFLAVVSGIVE